MGTMAIRNRSTYTELTQLRQIAMGLYQKVPHAVTMLTEVKGSPVVDYNFTLNMFVYLFVYCLFV